MIQRPDTAPEVERAAPRAPEIEITTHDVPIAGLPREMHHVTIVQLSDFHRGNGGADPLIEAAVRRANAMEPDYIFLTGDFVNHRRRDVLPAVKLVSNLRARRGRFAVLGNHDYRADPALLTSALEAASIPVLHNTAREIAPGFWLAGVDDLYEGNPDLDASLSPVPDGAAAILLSHHPGALDYTRPDRPLLILSGHTHGGQVRLPFPTPEMICWKHLRTRYVHGWYRRGAVRMYVNRGLGVAGSWLFARRYRCHPEISQFRLLPAR